MILMEYEQLKQVERIVNHYGALNQKIKTIEELNELEVAVLKDISKHENNRNDVIEEIADVCIMIEQVLYLYDIPDELIDFVIAKKINRTLERMNDENNNS